VKSLLFLLAAVTLLSGCATSTVESRKKERAAAYTGLSAELKAAVDQGRIKIGMPMDAVYIAWGPEAQAVESEDPGGAATVWLYEGGWMEEDRFWYGRHVAFSYQPRTYVRAEVVFVNGIVRSWRTLPQPVQ